MLNKNRVSVISLHKDMFKFSILYDKLYPIKKDY